MSAVLSLSHASWTASSASAAEPSMRNATCRKWLRCYSKEAASSVMDSPQPYTLAADRAGRGGCNTSAQRTNRHAAEVAALFIHSREGHGPREGLLRTKARVQTQRRNRRWRALRVRRRD